MKAYIALSLVFALCGIAASQDAKEELMKLGNECFKDAKIEVKDFEKLVDGKIKPEDAAEDLKCATKCFMEKSGFITASGELNAEGVKAKLSSYIPAEELDRVIQACKDTKGSNPCDMAFKLSNCMAQNKPPK